jgi:hypothetical protein
MLTLKYGLNFQTALPETTPNLLPMMSQTHQEQHARTDQQHCEEIINQIENKMKAKCKKNRLH